jgi:hypothetical protein
MWGKMGDAVSWSRDDARRLRPLEPSESPRSNPPREVDERCGVLKVCSGGFH